MYVSGVCGQGDINSTVGRVILIISAKRSVKRAGWKGRGPPRFMLQALEKHTWV